jgi:hypothetical protein
MPKQKPRLRTCEICGKDFITEAWSQRYCSDACQQEGIRKREAEKLKKLEAKSGKRSMTIDEVAALARAKHMSYGQYVMLHETLPRRKLWKSKKDTNT